MICYIWTILGIAAIYISVPIGWFQQLRKVIRYYINWSKTDGPYMLKHLRREVSHLSQRLAFMEYLINGKSKKSFDQAEIEGKENAPVEIEIERGSP